MARPTVETPGGSNDAGPASVRLRELARLFLKLGTVGFGGPAAHVALMELGSAALHDVVTVTLAVASAALLLLFRASPTWLILGGAAAGLVLRG